MFIDVLLMMCGYRSALPLCVGFSKLKGKMLGCSQQGAAEQDQHLDLPMGMSCFTIQLLYIRNLISGYSQGLSGTLTIPEYSQGLSGTQTIPGYSQELSSL